MNVNYFQQVILVCYPFCGMVMIKHSNMVLDVCQTFFASIKIWIFMYIVYIRHGAHSFSYFIAADMKPIMSNVAELWLRLLTKSLIETIYVHIAIVAYDLWDTICNQR